MIAIEILADEDKWLDLGGVNIMLSFSLIHNSVDRGTAFDIAGKGVLNSSSLVEAIDYVRRLSSGRRAKAVAAKEVR